MKISPITQYNMSSFRAGKTYFYSDFDGTYFPFNQNILNQECEEQTKMDKMYSEFKTFIQKAKDKFNIIITTGRSKEEMKYVLNNIKNSNKTFCPPQLYIFRNGIEEVNTDSTGFILNTDENNENKNVLKTNVKKIINSIDNSITILEPEINKTMNDYGEKSLEYRIKCLPPEKRNKFISIVTENNGLVELVFSPNINTEPYLKKLKDFFNKSQYVIYNSNSDKNFFIPLQTGNSEDYKYLPGKSIILSPIINNKIPDKINNPKEKVREIIETGANDLIIVTGDGSNDINMLNPLEYLDIYGINTDKSKSIEENLSDERIVNAIKKLPLISIVVGNNKEINNILEIKQLFDKIKIKKILKAENSEEDLLNQIKYAMLIYSDTNDKYKHNLGYNLYTDILE